ncbi:MAG: dihydrofolate reductase [Alphaproteobacteria bacterium]
MKPCISLIAATSENGVIGHKNSLPWHLPEELKYFKKMTAGKPVIMGRKTFDSMGKRPLPNRVNIIISRDPQPTLGCHVVSSIEEALHAAGNCEEIMVIGGAQIYESFLPLASKIYLTVVHQECEGDTCFPEVSWKEWSLVSAENHGAFTTKVFERR